MNEKKDKVFTCPTCKSKVGLELLGKGGTFPFCSDRCRLIDLGRWIDCEYKIEANENDKMNEFSDDL